MANARIVCSTVTTCLYNGFASGPFDVVLVDEASQISLAVWPCLMNRAGAKKFVVAGDPMQLEPVGAMARKGVDPEVVRKQAIWRTVKRECGDVRKCCQCGNVASSNVASFQLR